MLSLSKLGRLRLWLHRPLPGTPKTVTISREADGWYACISCADVPSEPLARSGNETGIDVGLTVLLITADGEPVDNPHYYRTAQQQLAQGSRRRRKAVQLLARTHQTVQRQRRDFHHTTALALLRQYDVVSLEEVQVANLVRNHHLATSISDAGWAAFRTILEATAACAGRQVIAIPPAYTSQDCSRVLPDGSRCGQRVATSLSVRTHVRCLPVLWAGAGPRRERGPHHSAGRAGPSGANVARWGERRLSSTPPQGVSRGEHVTSRGHGRCSPWAQRWWYGR
jgi:putative transposase